MSNTVAELNQRWGGDMDGIGCDNLALGGIHVTGWDECVTLLLLTVQ